VVEIYPAGPIGGGLTQYGKTQTSSITENDQSLIHFEQPAGNGNWMIRWFPNHKPLILANLSTTANLQLAIELRSATDVNTTVHVDWKTDDRKPGEKAVSSQLIELKANQWVQVLTPLPTADMQMSLKGLMVHMGKPGSFDIRSMRIVTSSPIQIQPLERDALFEADTVQLGGKASADITNVQLTITMDQEDGEHVAVNQNIPVQNNQFSYTLNASLLKPGHLYHVQWKSPTDTQALIDQPLFAYIKLKNSKLPVVIKQDGKLYAAGKPFAFVGINYTKFQLGFSNRSDFEKLTRQLMQIKDWGIRVTRVPINIGLIQVAPGIFPDNPQWATIMREHHLDPRFFELLEYHIQLAAELGIYTVIDWHGYANNPYRYFLGGMPSDQEKGKPGTAIAWLAPDNMTKVSLDMSNPLHCKALADTHAWTAKHFKGNPNILGIEVPFNEPHDAYAAVEANWRRMTDECAKAVKREDPDRLTFAMGSSYSHDNATASGTWLLPDRADGSGNHFYMSNGPVALRPDASTFKHPWLARDVNATFKVASTAVLLPFSTQQYPQYNGEDGDHGFDSLLPDVEHTLAARMMIECGMVKNWFAGQAGYVLWTMQDNKHFTMFRDVYESLFKKYAPLYNAGPVDWANADVLFIQNPAADKIANGHNYSCVPIAAIMLDLHLDPIHYMTDDQFMSVGVARYAKGLEQVQEGARDLAYKAVVLDTRNCDQRVIKMVEKMKIPTLITDDISKVSEEQLAKFLSDAGVTVDQQTPTSLQLGIGPKHVVIYNHTAQAVTATAYPRVKRDSQFKLVTADGKNIFTGTAAQLQSQGVQVSIEPRTALILEIQ
jgi:hypothetical protein